jgi:hypothetical protein
MRQRIIVSMGVASAIALVSIMAPTIRGQANPSAAAQTTQARQAARPGPAPKTAWGDPDLQGIWTDEYQVPLQRPTVYKNKEFFTDQERDEIDRQRAALLRREVRVERGTEKDVAGAYNAVFQSIKHTGRRTSLIVDPPDGRLPEITEQQKRLNEADRALRLAMLTSTTTCKNKEPGCAGGTYSPTASPRRSEQTPQYNSARINRKDGPEDLSFNERCWGGVLPDVAGYRRIVQTPGGGVTMYYDVGQGQGWQRNINMTGAPHVPAAVRQWRGDSRGRWDGNTLVVDVTNFSPTSNFQGSRENLHVVERWTRLDANTLEYAVTISDPTVWTKPWTMKQELNKQSDEGNRIYYEPRCLEGNYGTPALLLGARMEEIAFSEGRGPDPATKDNATCFGGDAGDDPLAGGGG